MLPIERRNEILHELMREGRVVVSELADHYQVTEETIRRDLEKLDKATASRVFDFLILSVISHSTFENIPV